MSLSNLTYNRGIRLSHIRFSLEAYISSRPPSRETGIGLINCSGQGLDRALIIKMNKGIAWIKADMKVKLN